MNIPSLDALRAGFAASVRALDLPPQVIDSLSTLYLPVARWVVEDSHQRHAPYILGVNGAQGSGKSTFCSLLADVLSVGFGRSVLVISIDDLYLSRQSREDLARSVHPLCLFRGVPGTHDTELGQRLFSALRDAESDQRIQVPRFDKSQDDRAPEHQWTEWTGRPDIILFEGWCVGTPAPPPWTGPINPRETKDDPDGVWARWSAQCHRDEYGVLFDRLDRLLMIQVESMNSVRQGRWLQEKKLREKTMSTDDDRAHPGLMTHSEVMAYVDLFERYTTHMLNVLPSQADVLVSRSDDLSYTLTRLNACAQPAGG